MSRADIPEAARTDFIIVVDEFHSYLYDGNSTMTDALAESRKYCTSYVLSKKMLEQLDPATLAGVLDGGVVLVCPSDSDRQSVGGSLLFENGLESLPEAILNKNRHNRLNREVFAGVGCN